MSIRSKARLLQSNLIGTDCKLVCAKQTLTIIRYGARTICQSVAECNCRLRYHRAAAVPYAPLKARSNSRSLSGSVFFPAEDGIRDGYPGNNITHGNQT